MRTLLHGSRFAVAALCCVAGEKTAQSDSARDPLVRIVRAAMAVELVTPDVSIEFVPGQDGVGTTLALPLLVRLGAMDFGGVTTRKHVFALAVGEPQLALGRRLDSRFRGVSSLRLGGGLYPQNLSLYAEAGYHLSQRSEESGAVVGLGLGYLPQHMASFGIALRQYRGEENRFSVGIDFSIPLNLWFE